MARYAVSNLLGLVGAAIGGVAGFYTYRWILTKGFVGADDSRCVPGPGMQSACAASVVYGGVLSAGSPGLCSAFSRIGIPT